jgi:hypothetical protein
MGFVPENRKDVFYAHTVNGKRTGVWTKISHGEGEIGEPLLHRMAKQLHLRRSELDSFVDGTMSVDDYNARLVADGVIRL